MSDRIQNWPQLRLGDAANVIHGWPFKSDQYVTNATDLPIVVAIGNFNYAGGFRFESSVVKHYAGTYPSEYELSPGSILLVMTCQTEGGEILGVPGRVPDDGRVYLHNQRLGRLQITRPDLLDEKFAFHLARSRDFNRQLFVTVSGSKILHTSPTRIADVSFASPSNSEQRNIAELLDALDDKIAANAKLAATADNLASTLYHRALASAAWVDATFDDLAKVSGGGTPSTKDPSYWDGDVLWATPTDVTALTGPYLERTARTVSEAGLRACSSELYPTGSILMTSRATIGAFALTQAPTAVNQGFIVVQPNDPELRLWLFHEMRSRVDEFISLANGATFLELSRGNFKKFKVRMAAPEIMRTFNDTARVLHGKARAAFAENATMTATRDALLPQLMSGKLRVKEAEALVEAAV